MMARLAEIINVSTANLRINVFSVNRLTKTLNPFPCMNSTYIEYRSNSLKSFLPPDKVSQAQEILSKILEEKPISYNVWTKACTMYISKKTSAAVTPGLIEKFIHSENLLLKETALYAQ